LKQVVEVVEEEDNSNHEEEFPIAPPTLPSSKGQ